MDSNGFWEAKVTGLDVWTSKEGLEEEPRFQMVEMVTDCRDANGHNS